MRADHWTLIYLLLAASIAAYWWWLGYPRTMEGATLFLHHLGLLRP